MLRLQFLLLTVLLATTPQVETRGFTITISTAHRTVTAGADIWIKVKISNSSNRDLDDSGGFSYEGIDPNLRFDVRDEKGKPVPKRVYPHPELNVGNAVNRTIRAGETLTTDQLVSTVYDIRKPGKYVIYVARRASDKPKDGEVKSNAVTVTVVP